MKRLKWSVYVILLLILASCTNNNKQKSGVAQPVSIYKVWQFKKSDSTANTNHKNTVWIGDNSLDMTNKDTLRFSYGNTNNKPTSYPYKVIHDTIFINNKPGYKILKLTAAELDLMSAFKNIGKQNIGKDSVVMIYLTK
jgi:hypothetical protein